MHGQSRLLFIALLCACSPHRQPPTVPDVLPVCPSAAADTTGWQRIQAGHVMSVLLPPGFEQDTSTGALFEFYHGGGRFIAATDTVEYRFLDPPPPGVGRVVSPAPGSPPCFAPPSGWLARRGEDRLVAGGRRLMVAWFRRIEFPDQWLLVTVKVAEARGREALIRIFASIAPNPVLWSRSR